MKPCWSIRIDAMDDVIVKILERSHPRHLFSLHLESKVGLDDYKKVNKIQAVYAKVLLKIRTRGNLLFIYLNLRHQQTVYLFNDLVILHPRHLFVSCKCILFFYTV